MKIQDQLSAVLTKMKTFCLLLLSYTICVTHLVLSCAVDDILIQRTSQLEINMDILNDFLVERIPGTSSHRHVQKSIIDRLSGVEGMLVERHTFESDTPNGKLPFTNIIGTFNRHAHKKFVYAAHYDSKVLPGERFIGIR